MKERLIMRGEVKAGAEALLMTKVIDRAATISRIIFPAQPIGEGYIEFRIGITKDDTEKEGIEPEWQDITSEMGSCDRLFLPLKPCDLKPAYYSGLIGWRMVIQLISTMPENQTLTFKCEIDEEIQRR